MLVTLEKIDGDKQMVEKNPEDHELDENDIYEPELIDKNLEDQEEKKSAKTAKLNLLLLILIACVIAVPAFITNQAGYYVDQTGSITNGYATSGWFLVWFWGYLGFGTEYDPVRYGGSYVPGAVIAYPGITILLILAIYMSIVILVVFVGSVGVINFMPEKGIAFMKSVAIFSIVAGIAENCILIAFDNVPASITGYLLIFLGIWML